MAELSASDPRESEKVKPAKRHRRRLATVFVVAHVVGLATSLHALMTVRTPQGTIAWAVSLNTMPLLAVPAYAIFGRSKFEGYVTQRRSSDLLADPQARAVAERFAPMVPEFARNSGAAFAGQRLADLSYLDGNEVELLVDGEATFASLLAGIDRAQKYVLIQFYIVRDDRIGRELRNRLAAKARQGVEVRFLYDELGSSDLPGSYRKALQAAGDVPAILDRPHPLAVAVPVREADQAHEARLARLDRRLAEQPAGALLDRHDGMRRLVRVDTDYDHR